jgi:hypothetical protein
MIGTDPPAGAPSRPHFKVALNLPHAGRVARRIVRFLPQAAPAGGGEAAAALGIAVKLVNLLDPWMDADENPPGEQALALRDRAAELGRELVSLIEKGGLGHDRLGQCVRNFFECLELGLEGADISLRAGEDPRSLQRPI